MIRSARLHADDDGTLSLIVADDPQAWIGACAQVRLDPLPATGTAGFELFRNDERVGRIERVHAVLLCRLAASGQADLLIVSAHQPPVLLPCRVDEARAIGV